MIRKQKSTSLLLSLLLAGQIACVLPAADASDFNLQDTVDAMGGGSSSAPSEGTFGRQRFSLTFDSRFGYDDNTLGQPDTATVDILDANGQVVRDSKGNIETRQIHVNTSDSAFLNFALGAGYVAVNPRLALTVGADVGVNYYFDRPGRSYDINGGLSARVNYKLTPRITLTASTYNAYESQGDYGATTLTNFNGEFNGGGRTPGTSAQRDGDYFYTTNYLSASYQLTSRSSFVFDDTIVAFAYDTDLYATDQDRIENYTGVEYRYLARPTLTLAADYRFGYVDYFSVSNDSYTHFLLGGLDYTFNPRLHGGFRAGVEFRTYIDALGDETSPYLEGNLTYDLNKNSHLSLSVHYGIEEGDLSAANSKANTFRFGSDFEQTITARLSAYLGFYYTHTRYETPDTNDLTIEEFGAQNFNEDTFDVAVGARYAFNRHVSGEIGYTHTSVISQVDVREYDRNRVFVGVRLAY